MNWVWPIAPAHEPVMRSGAMWMSPRTLLDLGRMTGDMFAWRPFLAALDLLKVTGHDVDDAALPFLGVRRMDVGMAQAVVARVSLTGELGYEINVRAADQRMLWEALQQTGGPVTGRERLWADAILLPQRPKIGSRKRKAA